MKVKEYFKKNQYTAILIILMVLVMLIFTVTKGGTFWKLGTWRGIVMQFPEYGVMTVGTMFCFLIGCIDMSFVMLGNFATVIAVMFMGTQMGEGEVSDGKAYLLILEAFLIVAVICAIGGIINGLLISKLGIPPVIATIAMQMVWMGVSIGITQGKSLSTIPQQYITLGHSNVLGFIPFPLLVFIIIFVIAALILKYTTYGKKLYMCGTNRKACKFSAINTDRMIIGTFVLADVICGIGSMLMVSTLNSAKADNGESYVMKIILILVLAGILPDGGIGKIGNMIFSILIIQMITSGVNMFPGLNTYHGSMIYGGLLIVVLVLSTRMGNGILNFKKKKA